MKKEITIYSKNSTPKLVKSNNSISFNKERNTIYKKNTIKSQIAAKINIYPKIKIKKLLMSLYFLLLLCLICFNISVKCNENDEQVSISFIILKTKIIGYVQILSEFFDFIPNETRINNYINPEIKKGYYFNTSESVIKLIWYYDIYSSYKMFYNCYNLTEINLSNFDSRNIEDTDYMFYGCSSLTSIDLSSFDTTNVASMSHMFYGCSSLTSIDLSSFETLNVGSMSQMFYGCSSLTSIDLSSFETSNVGSMSQMFYGCSSLVSLDLSSFETSNVVSMLQIFSGCSSLVSLDLSYFNLEKVKIMNLTFYNCSNLEYINLYEANLNAQDFITSIMEYSSKNITICSNKILTAIIKIIT